MIAPLPAFKAELAEVFPGVEFHVESHHFWLSAGLILIATAKRHRKVGVHVKADAVGYQVGRSHGATLREANEAHLRAVADRRSS